MHKKFEANWTKIKGGCQSERKVSQLNSYSKMPLRISFFTSNNLFPDFYAPEPNKEVLKKT